jgi:hypothetical protein
MLWEGRSETANSQSMLWERRLVGNCKLPVDVMGKAGKAVGNYELPVDVNEKAVIFASFLSVISRVPVLGFIKRVFSLLFLQVLLKSPPGLGKPSYFSFFFPPFPFRKKSGLTDFFILFFSFFVPFSIFIFFYSSSSSFFLPFSTLGLIKEY